MPLRVPDAFIQMDAMIKEVCKQVVMKIRGRLVDWLVELDHVAYKNYVLIENGQRLLYLIIMKVIYMMLEASFLWCRN